jgi:glycosyltransferase involved in cell wall biosynthesis
VKVAQLMAGAPNGGAELFFERLCAGLARAGDEVLPVIRSNPDRAARLQADGLSPTELSFGGRLDVLTRPRLAAVLRRFSPRIAVAWMNRAARMAPVGDWVLAGRLGGYYDLSYYRRCDHLIGNTRGIVTWIRDQGYAPERVHYLPNFAPDLAGATPDRAGVPTDRKLVLALGRLHRNKAFDVLVQAMTRLPGVHAVIAGDGPERDDLAVLARRSNVGDRMHFPGWRADTASLLAGADLLVCPSRVEPLGNVVIEAWSARRPVVASLADGPRELISPGADGMLVPVEDAAALAVNIEAVLDNPALSARLVAAGRARYEAEFAEAPVVARWRDFLQHAEKA